MRAWRSVRRRRRVARAATRSNLPPSVRDLLTTPHPPSHLPWRAATYTVLDLELTGLNPVRDAIVAAGGLRVVGGRGVAGSAFRLLVRPDRTVPAAAVRVHGLLPQELDAAPPLAAQLQTLLARIKGDVLVVHVAAVDLRFLDAAMRRIWDVPLAVVVLDTARLAAALERRRHLTRPLGPPPTWRLADLASAHGLPVHPEHDPLADALSTAELFLALATRLERHGLGTLGGLRRLGGV